MVERTGYSQENSIHNRSTINNASTTSRLLLDIRTPTPSLCSAGGSDGPLIVATGSQVGGILSRETTIRETSMPSTGNLSRNNGEVYAHCLHFSPGAVPCSTIRRSQ